MATMSKSGIASAFASGTFPPQYAPHSASARCTRLPNVSARSEFCRVATASSEKVTSLPYGASRTRK